VIHDGNDLTGFLREKSHEKKRANGLVHSPLLISPICPWYLRDCGVDRWAIGLPRAPSVGEMNSPLSRFVLRRRFMCLSGYGNCAFGGETKFTLSLRLSELCRLGGDEARLAG
jgi:hypothetical protein